MSEVVLQTCRLTELMHWFRDDFFFRLDQLTPADDPSIILLSFNDLHLRLVRCSSPTDVSKLKIRLFIGDDRRWKFTETTKEFLSPEGIQIELIRKDDDGQMVVLAPWKSRMEISRLEEGEETWVVGRIGMRYRDFIPERQAGHLIASHILIEDGQSIRDSVHYHQVTFQLIYVYHGWVRLLYEDQGESFVLREGDCVLQPPTIRHRVLESSDQLQVVEIASPAQHPTYFDHQMTLPNETIDLEREFQGQRFLKYLSAEDHRDWINWRIEPFQSREIGINQATNGLISFTLVRLPPSANDHRQSRFEHDAQWVFLFILRGHLLLEVNGEKFDPLKEAHSIVLPAQQSYSFLDYSDDLQFFELSLPAKFLTHIQE